MTATLTPPRMTSLQPGEQVQIPGGRTVTFLHYGDPRTSCPDTHLSWPGMRIAVVWDDRYEREDNYWEKDLRETPQQAAA